MLEYDPPYLSWSPWNIEQHSTLIANFKNMPLSLADQLTSSNTRTLYYIPSVLPQQHPHPQNAAKFTLFKQPTNESRNYIPFNWANTPFSNFFPCNFTYETQSFHNTEWIYQGLKSIDIGNHYIASEIQKLTDGYAIKNVVMCYLYQQLNDGGPEEVSPLIFELIELKYDQVQAFKDACHESDQSLLVENKILTYFGVLVADAMKPITRTSWNL